MTNEQKQAIIKEMNRQNRRTEQLESEHRRNLNDINIKSKWLQALTKLQGMILIAQIAGITDEEIKGIGVTMF